MSHSTSHMTRKHMFKGELLTRMFLLFLTTTRGPPESPWQVLLPPVPLVQTLPSLINPKNQMLHAELVMTGRVTWLRYWPVVRLPAEEK